MIGFSETGGGAARQQQITSLIAGRISSGLHLGVLAYGDKLPSTRELAKEMGVDPRVIMGAYKSLEDRGIVEMRTRSGIYVANRDTGAGQAAARNAWLVDVLAEGLEQGIPAAGFAERVRRSFQALRLRATVLECNDDQLFSVADELERDYGLEVTAIDMDGADSNVMLAGGTDCVITTTQHADAATALAAKLEVPSLVVSMCDDLFAEVRRLLANEKVYFVVSDVRFEQKLRRIFANDDGAKNLCVLIEGRDAIDSIPSHAPAYVTRLTRKKLGVAPLLERLLPEARVFSEASSRELLTFIVSANQVVSAPLLPR